MIAPVAASRAPARRRISAPGLAQLAALGGGLVVFLFLAGQSLAPFFATGDFHPAALAASLLECSLVVSAMAVWVMARDTITILPTFAAVGTTVIGAFAV